MLRHVYQGKKWVELKQKEKGDKATLMQSYVAGEKVPNLFEAKDAQRALMAEYEKEFSEIFIRKAFKKICQQLSSEGLFRKTFQEIPRDIFSEIFIRIIY